MREKSETFTNLGEKYWKKKNSKGMVKILLNKREWNRFFHFIIIFKSHQKLIKVNRKYNVAYGYQPANQAGNSSTINNNKKKYFFLTNQQSAWPFFS